MMSRVVRRAQRGEICCYRSRNMSKNRLVTIIDGILHVGCKSDGVGQRESGTKARMAMQHTITRANGYAIHIWSLRHP